MQAEYLKRLGRRSISRVGVNYDDSMVKVTVDDI